MARIRTIKPEFWTSPSTRRMGPLARLMFIGTWNLADDEGRLLWDRDYLRGHLFMSDNPTDALMESLMEECVKAQVILPYEVEGVSYAQVVNFRKHQVINRPSKSKLPPPAPSAQVTPPFSESSVIPPAPFTEPSVPEQGTGNRERNDDNISVSDTGESSSSWARCQEALDAITDAIVADRVAGGLKPLNPAAYRQGVKGNVWTEHGALITKGVLAGLLPEQIKREVRGAMVGNVASPIRRTQSVLDAESFANARFLTGMSHAEATAEIDGQFDPLSDEWEAATAEAHRLWAGEGDDDD